MSVEEASKKASRPQVVKLNQAFKLAEKWVNSMTKTMENESTLVVLEPRPARLGIGAAVPRVSKVVPSNDPVERRLRAKLDAGKRRVGDSAKESALSAKDESHDESSDEEESESRTKAFVKKRPAGSTPSSLQPKKKQK